jgi:transcriptional regulator with XRE-family HTH domain
MSNENEIAFLCKRLKELREKNNCTMDEMAQKLAVNGIASNKSSISRVEAGKTSEKTLFETARKYCEAFGMSEKQTDQFLRGERVAVPDTSALLKNSQLIDELNKEYSKVIIPKVVVDELDNIENKKSGPLGRKAWEVIRGISYGDRTILMGYTGDSDEENEDCKIIYIAQEASDKYHCKVDIITEDTDYSAYLKGNESVAALHLREYMATKQELINMSKISKFHRLRMVLSTHGNYVLLGRCAGGRWRYNHCGCSFRRINRHSVSGNTDFSAEHRLSRYCSIHEHRLG